ncbi:small nuclear ribonucleoprotein G isoform X1 [Pongo abelii]|uniref:Small nuclear ribonucleoprotein G n=1 Tax=Pongo abelii TaxID=9601 RepID=A0A8I5TQN2_PONAB
MSKAHPPELKKFMDKKLSLKLNGGRHVQGILRGFDPFMNLVIDECVEMATSGQQNNIGMVLCVCWLGTVAHIYNPSTLRG